MSDQMTPDEFDALLESEPVELDDDQKMQRISKLAADQLIYQPEVARALVSGVPIDDLARIIGVGPATLRKRIQTGPMSDLMKIEAHRVIKHLGTRDLGKEKYLGLATALATMIDKFRLLDNEPTEITRNVSRETIERITIGLFGTTGTGEGQRDRRILEANAEDEPAAIPQNAGPDGEG